MNFEQPVWHRCNISRRDLKQLMRRTDRDGLLWFSGFLGLLTATGYLASLSLGSWWVIPAFLLYGTIWNFSNAIAHECGHGTPFRSRWLNETVLYIVSILNLEEPTFGRWVHARHHTHTSLRGKDPEFYLPNPVGWRQLAIESTGLTTYWYYLKWNFQHAFGYISNQIRECVPESEFSKMCGNSRIILGVYGGVIIWAILAASWWPVLMFILPRIVGAGPLAIIQSTQHAGLESDVFDHRRSSRTMYLNPVLRFLYWNMNYHIEHHMFPMVPFHSLPKLHGQIKDQLPAPSEGLISTYREIFSAISRQQKDPSFAITPVLPQGFSSAKPGGATQ